MLQTMTLDEKLAISMKACALRQVGTKPLLESGWNLFEAEAEFGRKGFATKGKAEEGRISYEVGISSAGYLEKQREALPDKP